MTIEKINMTEGLNIKDKKTYVPKYNSFLLLVDKVNQIIDFLNKEEAEWKPIGEYYFIDSYGEVDCGYWSNLKKDKFRLAEKNVFKSESEAEEALSRKLKTYGLE